MELCHLKITCDISLFFIQYLFLSEEIAVMFLRNIFVDCILEKNSPALNGTFEVSFNFPVSNKYKYEIKIM